ncbi:MAG: hypothetical protein PHW86_06475, partial [Candidatus Bipolaricaulis sp.]|nr:hypothetical protein [Candidatus Bipolaricaulis sp.]
MRWRSSSWALVAIVLCCMLGAAQQPSMIGLDGGAAVSNPGGMYAGNSGVVYTAVAFDVDAGARFAGAWGDPALGANWAAIPADHNAGNFYHDGDATNIALRVSFENVNLTDLNFLLAGNGGCGILGVRDVASPGFGLEPHAADVAIYDMTQQGAGWPPAAGDPTDATRHYLFQSWQRDASYIGSTGEGPDQGWNSNPTGGPSGTDESYDTFDVVLEFAPQADGTVRMYVFERIHNTWDIWSNGVMKWNPHDWHWNGVNRYYNVLPKANGGDYMTDVYVFAAAGNGPFATTIGGHTITWSEIWVRGTVANRPVIAWVDGAWTGPNDDGGHTWGYDGFSVIQSAVDAVELAGTVNVAAGAYTEQVVVDAALNLIGSGPSTVIEAPDKLTQYFMSGSNKNYPIIYVHDTDNAVIQDLVVDGLGKGNTNSRFVGIGFYNAGGAVDNVEIRNVENTPFSGAQHGVGIYAYNADGTPRALIITGCSVHDFQKNAMALLGAGLTVDVSGNNVVVGEGRTAAIAQNGIQVGSGAGGRIADNAVSGVWYTGMYWGSTGILILDAAPGIQILRNTVTDCQMGINSDTDQTLAEGNTVIGSDWAIILYGNDSLAAGNDIVGSAYGLYADGNGAEFLGNVVRGADWSALLYGAGAELHYNSISGSTSGFYSDLSADASLNWWGDATGPSFDQDMDGSTEYDGLGEAVYGSVVFSPWLALDPDGDSSAPGVQVTAPVLIVV